MSWRQTYRWRLHWFDKWERVLDDALDSLPKHPLWPNELLRILFEAPSPARKRIALVLDRGVPIAMVGLRAQGPDCYIPLAQYFIPEFLLVGKQELAESVLMRLRIPLMVSWWRMPSEPPSLSRTVNSVKTAQHYIADLAEDPEVYWRSSGHLNTVHRMRNRCREFTFAVNPPDGAEWVIKNWAEHWKIGPEEIEDRVVAARYLEGLGKQYSLLLLDGDKVVAGHTFVLHRKDLVWLVTHRDESYDSYGVGTRLMDLAIHWAKQSGFQHFDLGTTQSYKARWAPMSSQWWYLLEIRPEFRSRIHQLMGYGRSLRGVLHDNKLARSVFRCLPRPIRNIVTAPFRER